MFSLRGVERRYTAGDSEFRLTVPHLDIAAGERVAFVGESGCGKSTLLEMLALMLRPDASETFEFRPIATAPPCDVARAWSNADAERLGALRQHHIGYVLQHGGLLPYLSVRENIHLPLWLLGIDDDSVAPHWAERLHIVAQLDRRPGQLSVGQRQRAAIARALAHRPAVLIADEPTASVDPVNAERIMAILTELTREFGVTLIVASHALGLMSRAGLRQIEHHVESADDVHMHVRVSDG